MIGRTSSESLRLAARSVIETLPESVRGEARRAWEMKARVGEAKQIIDTLQADSTALAIEVEAAHRRVPIIVALEKLFDCCGDEVPDPGELRRLLELHAPTGTFHQKVRFEALLDTLLELREHNELRRLLE